ncbi:Chaperone DnaJ-domain superfamily protein [Euphorbia peplus]|nr:Chaperone DnaJ-domain superfamily protein [Euphorbia peplus]
MNENQNPNRAEAERLLGVAEKLLQSRDLNGCRDFAVLAQETEPLLEGSDQILAVADVLLSSEKRINNHHDWYAILQIDPHPTSSDEDLDLLKKQYRRLALLLHPDKNKFPFADQAFKLVLDAWAVFSDSSKKSIFDNELSSSGKLPVRRSHRPKQPPTEPVNVAAKVSSAFWTACPYCYILYEYPRVYQECCMRCQNCNRAFHAALISSLPPLVPGQDAYYCCWGFFPLGFVENGPKNTAPPDGPAFPNWMPPIFNPPAQQQQQQPQPPVFSWKNQPSANVNATPTPPKTVIGLKARGGGSVQVSDVTAPGFVPKKRGRPKKFPMQAS